MKKQGDIVKTIGLIGGMSWRSFFPSSITALSTTAVNRQKKLGGLHLGLQKAFWFRFILLEIEILQTSQGKWVEAAQLLIEAAQKNFVKTVRRILLFFVPIPCTRWQRNPGQRQNSTPAYCRRHCSTGKRCRHPEDRVYSGTRLTMEEDFYKGRLT